MEEKINELDNFYGAQYHNESLYNFSELLEYCINESSSPFNRDIDSQLKCVKERTTYEELTNIIKGKYVVFYHNSKNVIYNKHKFIIQLENCHSGGNGAMGAIRFKYNKIKDEYVFPSFFDDGLIENGLKEFDDKFDESYVDGRKIFHYLTYWFPKRFFLGSKIFNTLKEAEKYYNSIKS